ncbi:MAG: hypothetical protein LBF72_00805 [Holosporales bacterium]|nr:hypothetical protein [Holosporales bacterium]
MVKKFLLGAAFGVSCLFGSAVAKADLSGGYVSVFTGTGYGKLAGKFFPKGNSASSGQTVQEANKWSGVIGLRAGYTHEIHGFLVGVDVSVGTDLVKYDSSEYKFAGTFNDKTGAGGFAPARVSDGISYISEGRGMVYGGGAISIGTKVAADMVIGARVGFEVERIRLKQCIFGLPVFGMQNGAGVGKTVTAMMEDNGVLGRYTGVIASTGTGELETNLYSVEPGVFLRYHINKNTFVEVQAGWKFGIPHAVDTKFYSQSVSNGQFAPISGAQASDIQQAPTSAVNEVGELRFGKSSGHVTVSFGYLF